MSISLKDRQRLRSLASKQMELANTDQMKKLYHEWELHGSFDAGSRPMVRIELGTFAPDIIPQLIECEGDEAKGIERMLLSNMVNHTLFGDDTLVQDHITVPMHTHFLPYGLPVNVTRSEGLGHHFVAHLHDLEEDYHLLKPSEFSINRDSTQQRIDILSELFGDILPVRFGGMSLVSSLTQAIVHIMDMQDMFVAMNDYPELFLETMDRLASDFVKFYSLLDSEKVLRSTTKDQHLCQGTYCFTNELPETDSPLATTDIWGYMDSQETSGISPRMFRELCLPAYKKVAERFGLLSYGCCEAVHEIWDNCMDTIPNMKKVSISPWCNEEFMGERLRGKKIVYLRKPTPNLIGVGVELDEVAVRKHIMDTVNAARGCSLEIIQRDVYQISNTSDKVKRYVQIIRECMNKHQR